MLIKNKIKEIEEYQRTVEIDNLEGQSHFDNICSITRRFFEGLESKPDMLREYAPHWIGQMDATMRWFDEKGVSDKPLMHIFDIVNEVFKQS